jgi:hypothetical protein
MIGCIDALPTKLGTTGNYSAIADLHTLQFTVTHALGFSVFTSHILTTDLLQSQCNFKSHMKSSFHSLIPFLPLFCNCQLNSIPRLPRPYPGRLVSWHSTQFLLTELFFIITLHWACSKHSLSIVGKACLQHRCVATEVTRLLLAYSLPRECVYRVVV